MQFILWQECIVPTIYQEKELAYKCPTWGLGKRVAAVAAATNLPVTCFAFWQEIFMFESITSQDLNEHKKFILWNLGMDLTWHMPT